MVDIRVLSGILRLSEDMELPQEERGLHLGEGCGRLGEGVCLGEGLPRRGCVLLGEFEDRNWDILVRLSDDFSCLGEGKLRPREPATL